MTKIKFEASRVSEVAEKASVDIRTVLKVAEGKPVKGKGKLDRILKALAALGLGLALLVVGCDGDSLTVEAPDAGLVIPDTGMAPTVSDVGSMPTASRATVAAPDAESQYHPDTSPVIADADPPVVDAQPAPDVDPPVSDVQPEAVLVVLGSCGAGMQEILAGGVASCVPMPGDTPDASALDTGPVSECVQLGGILAANGIDCVHCHDGICNTSTCGNGIMETGEACDCGTDPILLPGGCMGPNGTTHNGQGCSTTCQPMVQP